METFKINYKSDFVLRLASDAGWGTAFTLEFWTKGSPTKRYYATHDGSGNYTNCKPDSDTELRVMFDDHGLGIGNLMLRITYSLADKEFRTGKDDEVVNVAAITVLNDEGEEVNVMLNLEGETAAEVQYSLPLLEAEKNRQNAEAQRNINETQRIAEEQKRETAETLRNQAELDRQASEDVRKSYERAREAAEQQRQTAEAARVAEFETNEAARKETFETNEAERQATFEANEAERQVLYEKVETNKEGIEFLNANTGISEYPEFSEAKAYAVGEVVLYEGLLKRFTSAHEPGAWDGSQVESWSERKEVDGLEEKVDVLDRTIGSNMQDIEADLAISDSKGFDIVQFANGHIKTKNFNSEESATKQEVKTIEDLVLSMGLQTTGIQESDLSISDGNNNDIVQFSGGHIKTKLFDSSKIGDVEIIKGSFEYIDGGYYQSTGTDNKGNYTGVEFVNGNGKYCEVDVEQYQGCLLRVKCGYSSEKILCAFFDEDNNFIHAFCAPSKTHHADASRVVILPIPRATDCTEFLGTYVKGAKYMRMSVPLEVDSTFSICKKYHCEAFTNKNIALIGSSNISYYFSGHMQYGYAYYLYQLAPMFGYNIFAKAVGGSAFITEGKAASGIFYNGDVADASFLRQFQRAMEELQSSSIKRKVFDIIIMADGANDGFGSFDNDYDKIIDGCLAYGTRVSGYEQMLTDDLASGLATQEDDGTIVYQEKTLGNAGRLRHRVLPYSKFEGLTASTRAGIECYFTMLDSCPRARLFFTSNVAVGAVQSFFNQCESRYLSPRLKWTNTTLRAFCDFFNAEPINLYNGTTWRAWKENGFNGLVNKTLPYYMSNDSVHANLIPGGWELFRFVMDKILRRFEVDILSGLE